MLTEISHGTVPDIDNIRGKYIVRVRQDTDGPINYGWNSYSVDDFDEIKPEHKGHCALLDAARGNQGDKDIAKLKDIGMAFYYDECPPSYYLDIQHVT
jgi:hypothetical protein